MAKKVYSDFISQLIEGGWLEASTGVFGVILGLVFKLYFDVNIVAHDVFYNTMVRISIGLLTMSSIIVNLAGALSLRTHRIASSAIIVSKMSFAPIIALLVSCCIGLLLLVFDQSLIRIARYCLAGGWSGLVFGASIRSVLLGMRILTINLQTHLNANDQP